MSIDPRSLDPRAFGVPSIQAENSDEQAQTLAEECAREMWRRDAVSRGLGMRIEEVGPGRAVVTMKIRPDMINGHGSCHGGVLFTLGDSCFGFACNSYDRICVAAGCSIEFMAPGREGDVLRAEAVEGARVGRSGVYDVRITNPDGEIVALFRGKSRELPGRVLAA